MVIQCGTEAWLKLSRVSIPSDTTKGLTIPIKKWYGRTMSPQNSRDRCKNVRKIAKRLIF